MPNSLTALWLTLAAFLPNLVFAILILVIGWLVALVISKLVENLLHRTTLDDRLAGMLRGGSPDRIPAEHTIAMVVFWLIMIFVILIFLQTLNLGAISTPINALLTQVLTFIPRLLAAAVLAVVAVVLATMLRLIITRVLSASGLSQRLSEGAKVEPRSRITIGQTIGNVVFWLVILLFLPAILDALQLQGILAPVQSMVNSILAALPNILGFALVLVVGYFVARIIRQIVSGLLSSIGVDRLSDRAGVQDTMGTQRLSDVLATIVFILVMIPVVIAALNVLNIPAVSQPAANMLNSLLNAIPNIFGAFLILAVAFFVAKLVSQLVSSLLSSIGFNRLFSASGPIPVMGLNTADAPSTGSKSLQLNRPSDIVGWVVMISIILFAVLQASQMLGFAALTLLIGQFIVAAWSVVFGLVIFGIGLWLSGVAYRMIRGTGSTGTTEILATAARIALVVFAAALALRQMGIAESIVNLAFGLMLGAVAVAAAIAFGIGGRDVAKDLLDRWRGQMDEQARRPIPPKPASPSGMVTPPIPQTGGSVSGSSDITSSTGSGMRQTGSISTQPIVPPREITPSEFDRDIDLTRPGGSIDPIDPIDPLRDETDFPN